jgi:hypothetical protein
MEKEKVDLLNMLPIELWPLIISSVSFSENLKNIYYLMGVNKRFKFLLY